jgi:hypothetical protein
MNVWTPSSAREAHACLFQYPQQVAADVGQFLG